MSEIAMPSQRSDRPAIPPHLKGKHQPIMTEETCVWSRLVPDIARRRHVRAIACLTLAVASLAVDVLVSGMSKVWA